MKEHYDLLQTIFDLLLSDDSPSLETNYKAPRDREPHIASKIEINFGINQRDNITTTFQTFLPDIDMVSKFFQNQYKINERPANRLVGRIRQIFLMLINSSQNGNKPNVSFTEIAINDFVIIERIAEELLKPYNRSFTNDEIMAAQCVVLCVFENCDIGLPPEKNKKFKNPKRYIEPTLFDDFYSKPTIKKKREK